MSINLIGNGFIWYIKTQFIVVTSSSTQPCPQRGRAFKRLPRSLHSLAMTKFFIINGLCKNYLLALLDSHLIHYPSPLNLTYAWSFGSSARICLIIQILSGIFLAMHYTPHIDLAFSSVEHIMRDVNNGWLIRYIHANGASMFFIVVYYYIL